MIEVVVVAVAVLATAANVWFFLRERKRTSLEREVSKIEKRLAKLPTESLPQWAEQSLGELGRSFSAWRRSGQDVLLDEAVLGAEVLSEVFRQIRDRSGR